MKHPNVVALLESLGLPVFMQGDMPQEMDYPDLFITYLWFSSSDLWRFDNRATATRYTCQITVYGREPNAVDDTVEALSEKLLKYGYSKEGGGRLIPSDEPEYLGWTNDYHFIVKE